jgi:hypothetical protein|uniref:Uncharacterized protein n=1 Tax=Zea mays TaxID=4577 RepID=C0HJ98_MAIZE|nr:unknown [Zea mays]
MTCWSGGYASSAGSATSTTPVCSSSTSAPPCTSSPYPVTSPASSWSTCTTSSSRPETSSRSVTPPLPDGLRGDASCCCVPISFVQARRTGWYWSPIAAVSTYVRMYCMFVIGTDRVLTCDLHGAARSCGCFLHAVLLCLPPNKCTRERRRRRRRRMLLIYPDLRVCSLTL